MPSAGFEPSIPASEPTQTHALKSAAIAFCLSICLRIILSQTLFPYCVKADTLTDIFLAFIIIIIAIIIIIIIIVIYLISTHKLSFKNYCLCL
jgi:hypothetical protein